MKTKLIVSLGLVAMLFGCSSNEEKVAETAPAAKKLFLDVHDIGPGKVNFEAVADAHKKDLATQGEFDVSFIKYWVDEQAGKRSETAPDRRDEEAKKEVVALWKIDLFPHHPSA